MLTGQAKKDYQREYMRDYMANHRAGLNKGLNKPEVLTQAEPVVWTGMLTKERQVSKAGSND